MSTVLPTPEGSTRAPSVSPAATSQIQTSKQHRVLACALCQKRKVKCDRQYPCANCIKSRAQCVQPSTQVSRKRRRRFPERELLERLRKYEDLLRQNNIKFEPLHNSSAPQNDSHEFEGSYDLENDQPVDFKADWSSPSTSAKSERVYKAKSLLHAMSQEFRDPDSNSDSLDDDVREMIIHKTWNQVFDNDDHLLFGSRKTNVNVSALHPEPVQIFKLWQLYLENINPLLKVTHTPSLQAQIIEAAGNILNIESPLEALMFGIYSMAITSITAEGCQAMFGSSRSDLLVKYQLGCQQTLLRCGFLRCGHRDCLTALYLYLFSIRSTTVPQSLSAMLGLAIRIAQRIGIDRESTLAKCTALEAEMRRRLWWSLVLLDARVGEMAEFKAASLSPTWDCKVPLNVNDSDFRLEMKEAPQVQGQSTEALFAVVRSELGNFVRHTTFHLDFTDPALKPTTKDAQDRIFPENSELISLENMIEDKYLKFCDPENPLHFMTIWVTRGYLAKCHLLEHHSRYSSSSVQQADSQHDAAMSYALSMLDCDTKIMTSPLTKGFHWLLHLYFPFTAYIQILQNLKRRPFGDQVEHAWEVMSDNYEARFGEAHFGFTRRDFNPFFNMFADFVLRAWQTCEEGYKQLGVPFSTPRIVLSSQQRLAQIAQSLQVSSTGQPDSSTAGGPHEFSMPLPSGSHLLYGRDGQDGYTAYPGMPGLAPLDVDINQIDWSAMDWDLVNAPASEANGPPGMLMRN